MIRPDALQKLDDTIINLRDLRVDMKLLDNFTLFEILSRSIDNLNFIHRQNTKDLKRDFEFIFIGDAN